MSNIVQTLTVVASALIADPCAGQTPPPRPPVQWTVDVTGFYEYDTNPLRVSFGSGDSHWRLFPSVDVQAPLSSRTTLFARSALRRDQYGATSLLNGTGLNGSLGIARRVAPRLSVWGAYDLSRSEQADVLEGSPSRFASYTQQGGSAGVVWRTRPTDVLRANGFGVRRQYRGLSSPLFPSASGQVDPVVGLGGSWTHTFDGHAESWSRIALNTTWHRSNNPAYRYTLPSASVAWGTTLRADTTVRLDGTLAWLKYDARPVGLSGVLRRDTIAELAATVAWRHDRRVEPFVRLSGQWDRSTDPLRTFADRRVLIGARVNVGGGGQRRAIGERRRPVSDLNDDPMVEGAGSDVKSGALAKIDLSYLHIQAGRWPEAEGAARAALALDPDNATAWANLGVALYKLGDSPGARQALERSLTLNPKNDPLRAVLAQLPQK
jgi:hypothetical protein